ncbi:AtpZ/AtpI family protein [Paenibacillus sediminis]|uniref:F0F1-type ATP synthase assembly protein I n=1 Tax=Paenibacillus sediminis TaxID=664909 RepID=A0ABS4H2E3_9BACL|nr:AtpZ/AtpI family protein [Paenibacillus sediminis]MBP1936705.1 F0F1-type ATP synthase assembly protein I [Paenibacillus sediminis]
MNKPEKPEKFDKNRSALLKAMGLVTSVGTYLAACALGGFYLGSWLDKTMNIPGLGIAIGVLLGLLVGGLSIVAIIKAVMGESDE